MLSDLSSADEAQANARLRAHSLGTCIDERESLLTRVARAKSEQFAVAADTAAREHDERE